MDNLHFNEMIDGDVCFLLDQPVQLFSIVLAHFAHVVLQNWFYFDDNSAVGHLRYIHSYFCVFVVLKIRRWITFFQSTTCAMKLKA
jgi:hypothetical protein